MEHTGDGAALRTITDLRQTKQGRIAVFFDGEFDFSVDDETLVQYHLAVGKRYTAGQYEQLRLQTQYKKAWTRLFRCCPAVLILLRSCGRSWNRIFPRTVCRRCLSGSKSWD